MQDTSRRRPALPKNYQLIYEIVERSGIGRHLTSSDIYAKALKRRPGIGFSTVYRGLERLRDLGMVSELHVPGTDAAAYEPAGFTPLVGRAVTFSAPCELTWDSDSSRVEGASV